MGLDRSELNRAIVREAVSGLPMFGDSFPEDR